MGAYIYWHPSWANLFYGLRDEKGKYLLRPNPSVQEYFHLKMEPLLVVKACTDTKQVGNTPLIDCWYWKLIDHLFYVQIKDSSCFFPFASSPMTITTLIIFKCFFLFVYDIGYDKDKSDFQTHIYRQSPISFSLVNIMWMTKGNNHLRRICYQPC